ncbi:MAG: flagellar export chaperone FlgN [Actinomycetes bacterium]
MSLADVSSILWRERELLDLLLFKLEEEQVLLASGRTRWLARATREVEVVLDEVRRTEVVRAAEVDEAARSLGLGPSPSLRTLADAAGEPWSTLLHEHREAFLTTTAEISALADANRTMLATGARAAREALLSLGDAPTTYTPDGSRASSGTYHRLVDEAF